MITYVRVLRLLYRVLIWRNTRNIAPVMQLSIFVLTIPPRTPGDLHQKFAPALGVLHPSFGQQWEFFYKQFLPFLEFSL